MQQNLADTWLRQFYGKMCFDDYVLLDRAVRTLESNKDGRRLPNELPAGGQATYGEFPWAPLRVMMPSNGYFNGAWNWDSAFHAMGVANWDPALAREQIQIFCQIQQEDGLFPDVMRQSDGSIVTAASKPPVLPWAAWCVEQKEHNADFLQTAYESFCRNERFWRERRGGDELGMFHYDASHEDPEACERFRRYESGWDNSPRWDRGVRQLFPVDLNCYMVLFYRAMAALAGVARHPEQEDIWREREEALVAAIEHTLWDDDAKCYLDYDYVHGVFSPTISPASFMPLFIRTATAERAEYMRQIAERHFDPGWPSVSYLDPAYNPVDYWRGRTWLNVAYFALKGLHLYGFDEVAERGRSRLLSWVRQTPGSIYETYDSQTGEPIGAPRFGWSSVFCIKFLLDWERPDY